MFANQPPLSLEALCQEKAAGTAYALQQDDQAMTDMQEDMKVEPSAASGNWNSRLDAEGQLHRRSICTLDVLRKKPPSPPRGMAQGALYSCFNHRGQMNLICDQVGQQHDASVGSPSP